MSTTESTKLDTWGLLELMGHRRLAGRITEEEHFGASFCRIDVPRADGSLVTQFYGPQAIYAMTPVDEATARAVALHNQPEPVHRYELLPPAPRNVRTFEEPGYASGDDDDEEIGL